jgi:hypothetical protein
MPDLMKRPQKVMVSDRYQKKYSYTLTELPGKNFDSEFKPDLTPKEMLELGVFGGKYFGDKPKEFPLDWWEDVVFPKGEKSDPNLNYYKVLASQSLSVWREKGWIHPDDPRGWFQWYCRYYLGRRGPDDDRQIKRWKAYRRHLAQVVKNCRKKDFDCRRKQRQSLLHWAYDARKY